MFSLTFLVASLVLARVAVANPFARAACNPTLAGSGVNIAVGSLEIGYASAVPGASVVSQALSTTAFEFIAETATTINGGFSLKTVNEPNQAAALFPTASNGALKLQTLVTPADGTQNFGFVCSTCNNPSTVAQGGVVASTCNVVSGVTGQCVQIGSAAGSAVTLATCSGSSSQSFDVYLA
ncbi:hypothetical protein C8R46DRAFT_1346718 [Mycena filopes]|nr:hypothetical protein C8R46DRAFT_1346718 [Mycena filopes]